LGQLIAFETWRGGKRKKRPVVVTIIREKGGKRWDEVKLVIAIPKRGERFFGEVPSIIQGFYVG